MVESFEINNSGSLSSFRSNVEDGHKRFSMVHRQSVEFGSFRVKKHSTSIPEDSSGNRNLKNPTTDFETLIHLLKGNIGSGYLALPEAVMHAGLWVGFAGTPVIGAICTHCMHLVLNSSRELCKRTGMEALNYEETAEMCFKCGPERLRKWDKTFYYIITSFLILTQLGFCCVYFVFVSQNVYQAVECIAGGTNLSQFNYMSITLIPVLLICYIPHLKYLAPVSVLANSCQLVGLILTFYYLVRDLPQVEMKVPAFRSWGGLPMFYGITLYAFEGIGLVLPLENNMKYPNHFPGWTGVLNSGMLLVICVYCGIGFFGYLRYGDTVLGSITLNLPGNEVLAQMVKLLMAFSSLLTYPLQYYVALSIMLPTVVSWVSSKQAKCLAEYVFRSVLVLITFILAALIPNIGLFTNIVGAVCSSALALVFPPIMDIVIRWPNNGKYHWRLWKNIFIVMFGVLGFITGSISSIKAIIEFFQTDDHTIETKCY